MELLQHILPSQSVLNLTSWELDTDSGRFVLKVNSTQEIAPCPLCHRPSDRIHSHYERTLQDLPCVQFSLTILLEVCKFFCSNVSCRRKIFTERLPDVVAPWARQTARYRERLKVIALSLGGNAAVR